jgi:hypothetical protein
MKSLYMKNLLKSSNVLNCLSVSNSLARIAASFCHNLPRITALYLLYLKGIVSQQFDTLLLVLLES